MGKQSRNKSRRDHKHIGPNFRFLSSTKPRIKEWSVLSHSMKFMAAMIAEEMESIYRNGRECVICHQIGNTPRCWLLSEEDSRAIGVTDGNCQPIVYSLCEKCETRRDRGDAVEAAILAKLCTKPTEAVPANEAV